VSTQQKLVDKSIDVLSGSKFCVWFSLYINLKTLKLIPKKSDFSSLDTHSASVSLFRCVSLRCAERSRVFAEASCAGGATRTAGDVIVVNQSGAVTSL